MKKIAYALMLMSTVYGMDGGFCPLMTVRQASIKCTPEIADAVLTQLHALDVQACATETSKTLPKEWAGKVYSNLIIDFLGRGEFEIRTYSFPQNSILQGKINNILSAAAIEPSDSGFSKHVTPLMRRLISSILDDKRYTALFSPQSPTLSLVEFSYSPADPLFPYSLRLVFMNKKDVEAYHAVLSALCAKIPFRQICPSFFIMETSYFINIYGSLSHGGMDIIKKSVDTTDLKEDDKTAFLSVLLESLEKDLMERGQSLVNILGDGK